MQLNFASAEQSEDDKMRDRVYAAMETGNHTQARSLLKEVRDRNEVLAESIRMDVLAEYGMAV